MPTKYISQDKWGFWCSQPSVLVPTSASTLSFCCLCVTLVGDISNICPLHLPTPLSSIFGCPAMVWRQQEAMRERVLAQPYSRQSSKLAGLG